MGVSKKYHTGFVLSGGFIKGFAHLGAIQALIERDIRPQIISSTSAGSLVGVLYADGNEPYQVLEFFLLVPPGTGKKNWIIYQDLVI